MTMKRAEPPPDGSKAAAYEALPGAARAFTVFRMT
jgi:hypothetical protein